MNADLRQEPSVVDAAPAPRSASTANRPARTSTRRRAAVMGDMRDTAVLRALLGAGTATTPAALLESLQNAPGAAWNVRKVTRALRSLCKRGRAQKTAYGLYSSVGHSDSKKDTQEGHSDSKKDSKGGGGYVQPFLIGEVEVEAAAAVVSGETVPRALGHSDSNSDTQTLNGAVVVPARVFEDLVATVRQVVEQNRELCEQVARLQSQSSARRLTGERDVKPENTSELDLALEERRREKEAAIAKGMTAEPPSWAGWEYGVRTGLTKNPKQMREALDRRRKRLELEAKKVEGEKAKTAQREQERERFERDRASLVDPDGAARIAQRSKEALAKALARKAIPT